MNWELMKTKCMSKVVWLTAVPLIANMIAVYNGAAGEKFETIAMTIVSLLALIGILNNPDERGHF